MFELYRLFQLGPAEVVFLFLKVLAAIFACWGVACLILWSLTKILSPARRTAFLRFLPTLRTIALLVSALFWGWVMWAAIVSSSLIRLFVGLLRGG